MGNGRYNNDTWIDTRIESQNGINNDTRMASWNDTRIEHGMIQEQNHRMASSNDTRMASWNDTRIEHGMIQEWHSWNDYKVYILVVTKFKNCLQKEYIPILFL